MLLLRLLSLVGLGISSALWFASFTSEGLCGHEGGCANVLQSSYSKILGIPLPIIGILYFLSVIVLSNISGKISFLFLRGLILAGGLAGTGLILLQMVVLKSYCPYCIVIDLTALLMAFISLAITMPEKATAPESQRPWKGPGWERAAWGAASLGSILFAFLVTYRPAIQPPKTIQPSGVPTQEIPEQVKSLRDPDVVTIVEISNISCPHCRALHTNLNLIEKELGNRIRRICITVPISRSPEALAIDRGIICAREHKKDKDIIDHLFRQPDTEVGEMIEKVSRMGIDSASFKTCMESQETVKKLGDQIKWVRQATPRGLPAIWIDDVSFEGVLAVETLKDSIQIAEAIRKEKK